MQMPECPHSPVVGPYRFEDRPTTGGKGPRINIGQHGEDGRSPRELHIATKSPAHLLVGSKGPMRPTTGMKGAQHQSLIARRFRSREDRTAMALRGFNKGEIRRLARRGGVKRISKEVYVETAETAESFIRKAVMAACTYCDGSQRKTVRVCDVNRALDHMGCRARVNIAGYGMVYGYE